MKLIHINGRAGVCDGYYDGRTVERAIKPLYVASLIESKQGIDMNEARLNTRDDAVPAGTCGAPTEKQS